MTINVHGIKTPPELIIYYGDKSVKNLSEYPCKVIRGGSRRIGLPDARRIYHVELQNLKTYTTYYFRVGDEKGALSEEFSFRTLPEESPLVFVEGGDWENTPKALLLAKKAASFSPHAVLLGGDYPSDVIAKEDYQRWDLWLSTYFETMRTKNGHLIPMIMAIGNHEVIGGFGKTEKEIPFFLNYFKQGETQKSFFSLSLGKDRHLFVLDSGHASSHGGEQLAWLSKELEKVAQKKVKMALYHVPLYPSIRFVKKNMVYRSLCGLVEACAGKSSAGKLFSYESSQGRKFWLPLFDKYHLTCAFEHHDQTLKRTKLLKNDKEDPKGTLYLGDGAWGAEFQYHPIQGYFHSYFANLMGKVHFFWIVHVDKQKIIYTAMDESGKILDQFIQKI